MTNTSRFILLFILFSTLLSLPQINIVKAGEIIYIRPDGSVEGTDKIERAGNIYTFTGDVFDSIVVGKDDIVVDGAGYTLQGEYKTQAGLGTTGIMIFGRSNVTIKNIKIKSFYLGLHLKLSSGNNISGNNITTELGILLGSSNYNNISGNIITKTRSGISLEGEMMVGSIHNIISGNYIINNRGEGIFIQGSSNQIIGNYIANNGNGTYFFSPPFGAASSNNLIYHNSYVNNARQIYIEKGFAMPDSINIWDNGVEGNYWRNYFGVDNDGDGIGDTPYFIDENNQDNYPLMNNRIPPLETTPPTISIASPENKTYTVNNVSLTFAVSITTSWIGYSLDGQANVTIAENTTLTGLSEGSHNLTVYANDTYGNTGASEIIYFTIAQKTELFPTTWIVVAIVIVAAVGAALLVYFRKVKKTTEKTE